MADHTSPIQFEDVPLDEARRMGRGPRMNPELYHAFKEKIQSLGVRFPEACFACLEPLLSLV